MAKDDDDDDKNGTVNLDLNDKRRWFVFVLLCCAGEPDLLVDVDAASYEQRRYFLHDQP